MQIPTDDIRRIERLHVRAWPAFETADIHGWLWRYSGGGSQRANSVSTVDFAGADPATALDEVEARYRARNALVRLHTYDLSAPTGLVDLLQTPGYRGGKAARTRCLGASKHGRPRRASKPWRCKPSPTMRPRSRSIAASVLRRWRPTGFGRNDARSALITADYPLASQAQARITHSLP